MAVIDGGRSSRLALGQTRGIRTSPHALDQRAAAHVVTPSGNTRDPQERLLPAASATDPIGDDRAVARTSSLLTPMMPALGAAGEVAEMTRPWVHAAPP